jgi:hypothetical protein
VIALHLSDAQFDKDGGLSETGGNGLEPVPIGFREAAALPVFRQTHVSEGKEHDSLSQVIVAASPFDEVLQADRFQV